MARAFPKSQFFGFDYHDKSIEAARESAKHEGVADRVSFAVATAKEFPGRDYDFVAAFDFLHDMGDPDRGGGACPPVAGEEWHVDDR